MKDESANVNRVDDNKSSICENGVAEELEEMKDWSAQCPCVSVDTWEDFFKIAVRVASGKWVFRGHESEEWGLTSGLEREHRFYETYANCVNSKAPTGHTKRLELHNNYDFWVDDLALSPTPESEQYAIRRFKQLVVGTMLDQRTLSDVEWLSVMQHYGTMTRLLDFSTSIMVALFFAFEKRILPNSPRRSIYAVNIGKIAEYLISRFDNAPNTILKREDLFLKFANSIISGESIGVDKGIVPIWLPGNNQRIIAQSGVFLLPIDFSGFEENLKCSLGVEKLASESEITANEFFSRDILGLNIFKLNFSKDLERTAWDILEQFNITPYHVYPDIVGVAKTVRYRKLYSLA